MKLSPTRHERGFFFNRAEAARRNLLPVHALSNLETRHAGADRAPEAVRFIEGLMR